MTSTPSCRRPGVAEVASRALRETVPDAGVAYRGLAASACPDVVAVEAAAAAVASPPTSSRVPEASAANSDPGSGLNPDPLVRPELHSDVTSDSQKLSFSAQ